MLVTVQRITKDINKEIAQTIYGKEPLELYDPIK